MKALRRHPKSVALGAVLAAGVLGMTSMTSAPPPQIGPAAPVCYHFDTIAKGQYSGFGDYCGAPINIPPDTPCISADVAPPCYACVATPAFEAIIRDECAWTDLWNEHASIFFPPPPVPVIDFDRFVVVAVISGARPDGCYEVEVHKITGSTDPCLNRTIHIRERIPCPFEACPDVITNPFHYVKVCKQLLPYEIPVCFEHRKRNVPCVAEIACFGTDG